MNGKKQPGGRQNLHLGCKSTDDSFRELNTEANSTFHSIRHASEGSYVNEVNPLLRKIGVRFSPNSPIK